MMKEVQFDEGAAIGLSDGHDPVIHKSTETV